MKRLVCISYGTPNESDRTHVNLLGGVQRSQKADRTFHRQRSPRIHHIPAHSRRRGCSLQIQRRGDPRLEWDFELVRLFLVCAGLAGLSPLEPPVDLVGVRVPPFAHPVLEAR